MVLAPRGPTESGPQILEPEVGSSPRLVEEERVEQGHLNCYLRSVKRLTFGVFPVTSAFAPSDSARTSEGQTERQRHATRQPQQAPFIHRVRASRRTVLCVWATSATLLSAPALALGSGHIIAMLAITLAFAVMITVPMHATIEIDSGARLTIRYLIYSFSDRLENIRVQATPKFDFRRDDRLGFRKLYQGTRLPCFNVGWFVLRNGAMAFVCLSRKRNARALKTRDGCYILVDPRIARRIQAVANPCDTRQPL